MQDRHAKCDKLLCLLNRPLDTNLECLFIGGAFLHFPYKAFLRGDQYLPDPEGAHGDGEKPDAVI